MTQADRERQTAFTKERRAQLRLALDVRRETYRTMAAQLRDAATEVQRLLAAAPSDYQQWVLPQLRAQISAALTEAERLMAATGTEAVRQTWDLGSTLLDRSLAAAGVEVAASLPGVSTTQLAGMRGGTVALIRDITGDAAARINAALARTVIGVQPVADLVAQVERIVDDGGRARALTITRTELGRIYSTAIHARMEQATDLLPGLRKQWRRSGKVHSRPRHDAVDGQIKGVDEPFVLPNGVELLYPREPSAPAAETINCGCESLPWMESWEVSTPGARPYSNEELLRKGAFSDPRELLAPGWANGA